MLLFTMTSRISRRARDTVDLDDTSDDEVFEVPTNQYYRALNSLPVPPREFPSGKTAPLPPGKTAPRNAEQEPQVVNLMRPVRRHTPNYGFKFINSCFKDNTRVRVDLCNLQRQWKGSEFKESDPVMLIYRHRENTLIMFATGKFRFMGPFHPTVNVAKKQLKQVPSIGRVIKNSPLTLQTCTVTFKLPGNGVHLPKLSAAMRRDRFQITFNKHEFPAISMYRWTPMHVNVFYSGNVVVVGSKGVMSQVRKIKRFLVNYINRNRSWGEYYGKRWMRD